MSFDRVIVVDWSAAGKPTTQKDSIWIACATPQGTQAENIATRHAAEARLATHIAEALGSGARLLLACDFAFGAPRGLAERLTGSPKALALWDWLAARITDTPQNGTNYRAIAAEMNRHFPGEGPFWGNGQKLETADLPRTKPALPKGISPFRRAETAGHENGLQPKTLWQLAGAGAVGAQSLTGIPMLHRLRAAHPGVVAVWPLEPHAAAPVVIAEAYLSLLKPEVAALVATGMTPDEAQTRTHAEAFLAMAQNGGLDALMTIAEPTDLLEAEGWYLGAGNAAAVTAAPAPALTPPRLRNDCFAMPQGVDWVPVDTALTRLRETLHPITTTETISLAQALGRVLAADMTAARANPSQANSAVDGYGFAHASTGAGLCQMPLVQGRAAAGQPFAGAVPHGQAIRILTGAILPEGVDTVVLEEDCATTARHVAFDGPIKPRANTRRAGEDIGAGDTALRAGQKLRPPDLALLAAIGRASVPVYRRLRVGVLSTGDEIVSQNAAPHQIYDANRPMLLALAQGWGMKPVDLGHCPDDTALIRDRLNRAATQCDAILTSGGASAGDEDHVSRLLSAEGALSSWRIAMKPGRPLALALWQGVPVFGLPGNPVAALTCAVILARPALAALSGAGWAIPQAMTLPAAFAKSKKAGRREYLRARLTAEGRVEVFASEGSGRISGLSWAEGLVELPDHALTIQPGDPVRFLPYAALFD
ncbi:molybdopterin molybdenumtransferase MoeA [Pseudorhodobacter sp. E13]|uniref:molybdopterin-binding protein n=1 Tax=Pseudorhodobacter sp. E13 TaxID=2487931 RepID=UPI000F8F6E48|nr:gephyrin-like molybdotransferase Glp [Pseudorhodobacter sp. E13]RUS58922.1 molybdopterin molybdenumtransferase MoeA [Pseudorhodobacter sp. E13]